MDRLRVEAALADAVRYGPNFAPHRDTASVSHLSRRELYEPKALHAILTTVGVQLGTDEVRVAASALQYGLAARCWSLMLGVWRCGGLILDLRALSYHVTAAGSVELILVDPQAWHCACSGTDDVAELIADVVIAQQLTGFHQALHEVVAVADGLLWGNAASALNSAARPLMSGQPSENLSAVTSAILSRDPLDGRLVRTSATGVRRRSCCLWYRTRHRDTCGDCPLTGRPVMRN